MTITAFEASPLCYLSIILISDHIALSPGCRCSDLVSGKRCHHYAMIILFIEELWWVLIAFLFVSYSLDTDAEDLKEQESVSRILAELLENQEDFFDTEEDDISTTNDYSSINDQVSNAYPASISLFTPADLIYIGRAFLAVFTLEPHMGVMGCRWLDILLLRISRSRIEVILQDCNWNVAYKWMFNQTLWGSIAFVLRRV